MANRIIFGGKVQDTQFDFNGKTVAKFIYNGKECILKALATINSFTGTFNDANLEQVFLSITTTVAERQFNQENKLTSISMPEVTSVGGNAFYYAGLTEINLPKVQTIGPYAFYNSYSAGYSVAVHGHPSFPELINVDQDAFGGTTGIETLHAPKLQTIGIRAFQQAKITTLDLPEATSIGSKAFYISPLTSINIPKADTIGDVAFGHTNNGASVTVTMKSKFNTTAEKNRIFGRTGASFGDPDYGNGWAHITFNWVP